MVRSASVDSSQKAAFSRLFCRGEHEVRDHAIYIERSPRIQVADPLVDGAII